MKARLPNAYRQKSKKDVEAENKELSLRVIRHVCRGFIVIMYKKYGWRKKRCYELITSVIDYLNSDHDEAEAEEILKELDLKMLSDSAEIET